MEIGIVPVWQESVTRQERSCGDKLVLVTIEPGRHCNADQHGGHKAEQKCDRNAREPGRSSPCSHYGHKFIFSSDSDGRIRIIGFWFFVLLAPFSNLSTNCADDIPKTKYFRRVTCLRRGRFYSNSNS